ncbi:MAG: TIGR04168 family protein [Lyngbya sp. HA4199-MV5]|nr:TIGR04168 family protein [Lyngbya sp. HA4199-MV5]
MTEQPHDQNRRSQKKQTPNRPTIAPAKATITIAVIGDVHDRWDAEDAIALKHLGVDLVLLVGDFGNESVGVVRSIAALDLPKAAVLGNHDAWYSATEWGIKKCPYDRTKEDRVQQQLDLLGEAHVGYSKLDFPALNLTVVGARPFSWGGSEWKNTDAFYRSRYGITSFAESTERIVQAASNALDTIIFVGHCGPKGLGDRAEDICGKDWHPPGGDHGDPDFADAIAATRKLGKTIPLVTFGHMHHQLRHTKQHQRVPLVDRDRTIYLNAACVPRIVKTDTNCLRSFSLVSLQDGNVVKASLVWLDQAMTLVSETVLYNSVFANERSDRYRPKLV